MKKKLIIGLTISAILGVGVAFGCGLAASSKVIPKSQNIEEIEKAKDEGYKQGYDEGLSSIFTEDSLEIMNDLYNSDYSIYATKLNDTDILLTTSTMSKQGLYLLRNGKYSQIYDSGCFWNKASQIDGKFLISATSSNGKGILAFDPENEKAIKIYDEGYGWVANQLENGLIIMTSTGTSGILKYNTITNIFEKIPNFEKKIRRATQAYDGTIILESAEYSGIRFFFLNEDGTVTDSTLSLGDSDWNEKVFLPNGNIIFTSTNNENRGGTSPYGLVLYDAQNKTISKIYDQGINWIPIEINDTKVIFTSVSTSSSSKGLLLYDISNNAVSLIYGNGRKWLYNVKLDNGDMILSSEYTEGIIYYNSNDNSVSPIYETGKFWDTFIKDETGVAISSSKNPEQGKLRYDFATGQVTKVVEE